MAGEEKRIYVVVANTVQHPLYDLRSGLKRGSLTRSIVQVPGRQIAQACHAVRRMGHSMTIRMVLGLFKHPPRTFKAAKEAIAAIAHLSYEPITTIILSCRDSFELEHCYNLLRDVAGVEAYKFHDTNPEVYGDGDVVTAFATVPVTASSMVGIIDYLPLWSPEVLENKV